MDYRATYVLGMPVYRYGFPSIPISPIEDVLKYLLSKNKAKIAKYSNACCNKV